MKQAFGILLKALLTICFAAVYILLYDYETGHSEPIKHDDDQDILVVRWPRTIMFTSVLGISLAAILIAADMRGNTTGKTPGTIIFLAVLINFCIWLPVLMVYGYTYSHIIGTDCMAFRFLWKEEIICFRDIAFYYEDSQNNLVIRMANGRKRKYMVSSWMLGCRELRSVLNQSHIQRKTTLEKRHHRLK